MKKEFVIPLKQQKDRILERFVNEVKDFTIEQKDNYLLLHKRKMDKYFVYIVSEINFFNNILPDSTLHELQEYLELDDNIICSGFYDFLH